MAGRRAMRSPMAAGEPADRGEDDDGHEREEHAELRNLPGHVAARAVHELRQEREE
jgi:hypothetical protein